jgi:hypothetical protein
MSRTKIKVQTVMQWVGWSLLAWATYSVTLDLTRYGAAWGRYWWFCNLALIGIGYGIVAKDRGLLIGFVAIACYTQIFWIFDNLFVVLSGQPRFGLVDYLYQPSFPMDEFLLTHYHYFTLPIAVVAILLMEKARESAVKKALFFNPLIFGVSYFVFPAEQNVNCIHRSCFPGLESLQGPLYALGFWGGIFLVHLAVAWVMEKHAFPWIGSRVAAKRAVIGLMGACCVLGSFLTYKNIQVRAAIPVARCENQPIGSVGVQCSYLRFSSKESVAMAYRGVNDSESRVLCRVEMSGHGARQLLHEQLPLEPRSSLQLETLLDTPKQDVAMRLDYWCVDSLNIKTASATAVSVPDPRFPDP